MSKAKSLVAKPKKGYKTAFEDRFCDMAYRHCLLGGTNKALGELFNVPTGTVDSWVHHKPAFRAAVQAGRVESDEYVAKSLFGRATGYSCPEEKVIMVGGKPEIVTLTKHYPPDATAAIFWLQNRRPDLWRDRRAVQHTGHIDFSALMAELDDPGGRAKLVNGTDK